MPRHRTEKHPRTKEWQRTAPCNAPWRIEAPGGSWEQRTCWRIFLPLHLTNLQTSDFVGELEWHKQQKRQAERKATCKIDVLQWNPKQPTPWQLHPGCHLNSSKIGIPFFFKPWLGVLAESPACSGLLVNHGRVYKLSSSRRAKSSKSSDSTETNHKTPATYDFIGSLHLIRLLSF